MASKFKAGMLNFIEVLNQMWDAFAAGPYNALPLTGGTVSGTVASTERFVALPVGVGNATSVFGSTGERGVSGSLILSMGVGGTSGLAFPAYFQWYTSSGHDLGGGNTFGGASCQVGLRVQSQQDNVESGNLLTITGGGHLTAAGRVQSGDRLVAPILQIGNFVSSSYSSVGATSQAQGNINLAVQNCATFLVSSGPFGSGTDTSLRLASNSLTGRSLNAGGTLNASGADYAEYMVKRFDCGVVHPGQIVGIDATGHLTDKWDMAISFAVKSTNPCMVGGDIWSAHLGPRPKAPEPVEPLPPAPVRHVASGDQLSDTDEQWEARQAAYAAVVAIHEDDVAAYDTAKSKFDVASLEFDTALEAARQTVDRIAFAGQVPVNLQGATPGQFIVPVQDGTGIAGLSIDEADITLRQYMRTLGRVIAIEDDGRARIIVKVA